jgi:hypothetical protein
MGTLRKYAMRLMDEYVPFTCGDAKYQEVVEKTGWKKTPDSGTTCGFLCQWLMWKLGVGDPKVLNWNTVRGTWETPKSDTPKKRDTTFVPALNISRIAHAGKPKFISTNPLDGLNLLEGPDGWVSSGMGRGPQCGDIVYIRYKTNNNDGHVFVFLYNMMGDRAKWRTAEAGFTGGTDAIKKWRTLELSGNKHGFTKINSDQTIDNQHREVFGWLDISQVDYDDVRLLDALKAAPATV